MAKIKPMAPGSKDAKKNGCLCPEKDNNYGAGAFIDLNDNAVFWYNKQCPLHGKANDILPDTILYDIKKI